MAQVDNVFSTVAAIGNREDLIDTIYMISPDEVPYSANAARVQATATLHEWQTDVLAAADGSNAQVEGDTTVRAASAPTTRLNNYCQISSKNATVSRTQQQVLKAGRSNEMSYQMDKRTRELRRDIETIQLQSQAKQAGTDDTTPGAGDGLPRLTGSLHSWVHTNTNREAGGTDPIGDGSNVGGDSITQRALTEDMLKDVLQKCFTSGGNPETIMCGPFNKGVISGFEGRTQARQNIPQTRIQAAADKYGSDFGDLDVIPNRFQRERDVWVLEMDMWAMANITMFDSEDLGRIGDAETRYIVSEYSVEARNEASSGLIADLNET